MNRRSIAAILAVAFVFAGAAAAFAATQEYDITVPVTVKLPKGAPGAGGETIGRSGSAAAASGITISCAVGRGGTLAYSTASGGATGATGSGSTHSQFFDSTGKLIPVLDVVVVVAEEQGNQGTGMGSANAGQYLCWGKLDNGTTPVNFISGNINAK
jgi:hypothetical protein